MASLLANVSRPMKTFTHVGYAWAHETSAQSGLLRSTNSSLARNPEESVVEVSEKSETCMHIRVGVRIHSFGSHWKEF